MTCSECENLALDYAVGALEPAEAEALRTHLRNGGCPACLGRLAEAEAVAAELPLALEPVAPPARARRALLEQVAAERAAREAVLPLHSDDPAMAARRRWSGPIGILAAAAAVVALGSLATLWVDGSRANELASVRSEADGARRQLSAREAEVADLTEAADHDKAARAVLSAKTDALAAEASARQTALAAAEKQRDAARKSLASAATALTAAEAGRDAAAKRAGSLNAALTEAKKGRSDADAEAEALAAAKDTQIKDLQASVAQYKGEADDLRATVQAAEQLVRTLQSKTLILASLPGTAEQPQAAGRLLLDPGAATWYFAADGLPQLPAAKTYEFWLIPKDGKGAGPVPAGLFGADAQGRAFLTGAVPPNVGDFAKAAVTVEPIGGSDAPTSPIRLAGTLGG